MIIGSEIALPKDTAAQTEADVEAMLAFYKAHFDTVDLVKCEKCAAFLAFELTGPDGMGMSPNEIGKYVVPIGGNLQAHRVRLDEAPTGERMVGYQCGARVENPKYAKAKAKYDKEIEAYDAEYNKLGKKAEKDGVDAPSYDPPVLEQAPFMICGNDTRLGDAERGKVPVGATQITLSPFEKHRIAEEIRQDKKHKPSFKKQGHKKHFETFSVERIQ